MLPSILLLANDLLSFRQLLALLGTMMILGGPDEVSMKSHEVLIVPPALFS